MVEQRHKTRRESDDILDFSKCPRFLQYELTPEQLDQLAVRLETKVTELQKQNFYKDVGKTVVNRFIWLIGAAVGGTALWLHSKGFFKLP